MIISHNMLAMNANRQYGINTTSKSETMEKLSSGYRINRAADDAAGLAISSKMRKQIRGLDQGVRNTQDGISLCQVAEGALAETTDMLQRINQLAIQAANGTNSKTDRQAIQQEINQIKQEINHIGETTKFNEEKVFVDSSTVESTILSVSDLVKSPAARRGYLSEPYYYVDETNVGTSRDISGWYSAATLDFSSIDETNINQLYDKSFSFNCSQSCVEKFTFIMINGDGSGHSWNSETQNVQYSEHIYTIDIHGMKEGKDIVKKIYDFISKNPVYPGEKEIFKGSIKVSHSNSIMKINDDTLIVLANGKKNSKEDAKNYYQNKYTNSTNSGAIDCSIKSTEHSPEPGQNIYPIQVGAEGRDKVNVVIDYMDSRYIGINDIDVSTVTGANKAIPKVERALSKILTTRSRLGAQQNRLEHSIRNVSNTLENTTAAESRIRDADMASEMVKLSNSNILTQAGEAMLVQANQLNQGVLSLLQ